MYISSDFRVFKIPRPNDFYYKAIPELSGQEILLVGIIYETLKRKPVRLLAVNFSRFRLDSIGGYTITDEEVNKAMYNFFHFGYSTAEDLAQRDMPLPIPKAPVIPTDKEKEVLYNYFRSNLFALAHEVPRIVEREILSLKETHQEHLNLIKTANKLRG